MKLALEYHAANPLISAPERSRQKRRPGHNPVWQPPDKKEAIFRFAKNEIIPITNNQAESDSRIMKLSMKISDCFRAKEGARAFVTPGDATITAKKRGWDIIRLWAFPPKAWPLGRRPPNAAGEEPAFVNYGDNSGPKMPTPYASSYQSSSWRNQGIAALKATVES